MSRSNPILTIGHSTHSLEAFLALLTRHGVTALADVRSTPYSRFNPQFNKDVLGQCLLLRGIKYVFLGRELGARTDDRSCYQNGRVQYARLARTALFRRGIERVARGAKDYKVVLMCAEREPLECHRALLVARSLAESGMGVQHVLPDGGLEPHHATMKRLLDVVGLPRGDLFRSTNELIADALALQEAKVAHVDEKLLAASTKDK